jgi:dynamin GTPase
MNTNHPDFVGFDAVVKGATGSKKKARTLGNQVIRKGWLSVVVSLFKGSSREYWFVLTSESLTFYRDNEEKEQKYSSRLKDLKICDNYRKWQIYNWDEIGRKKNKNTV